MMNNITKLYVIEKVNSEKLYFAKRIDRNYAYNMMNGYDQRTCKMYEIAL